MTREELTVEMHHEAHRLRSAITTLMAIARRLGDPPSEALERSKQNAQTQCDYLKALADKLDDWTHAVNPTSAPRSGRMVGASK